MGLRGGMEPWGTGGSKAGVVGWLRGNGVGCGPPIWGAAPWKGDGAPWPPPPSATAMKRLWVAALLLLCVCHVGAAAVPQTEDPPESPPDTTTLLSRHFQTLSDFITKELPQRLRADEIQQQAKYVWGWDVGRPHRDPPPRTKPPCVPQGLR